MLMTYLYLELAIMLCMIVNVFLLGGLKVSSCDVHFHIVLELLVKLSADVLPTSCSCIIQVEEPSKSSSGQCALEHQSKYFLRHT